MRTRVLVVGGAEATAGIVADLHRGGWEVTTVPGQSDGVAHGRVLSGGHGGAAGLVRVIAEADAEVILDAAAPFDVELHADAAEAARATGVPMVGFAPPSFLATAGEGAPGPRDGAPVPLADAAQAAGWAQRCGSHVLVDCAGGILDPAAFAGDTANQYVLRRPPRQARMWPARHRDIAPAGAAEEAALTDNQIDAVVLPDTGEAALAATVTAARARRVPVGVLTRPQAFAAGVQVYSDPRDAVHAL